MARLSEIWQGLKAALRRLTGKGEGAQVPHPQATSNWFAETKAIADANLRAAEAWQAEAETRKQARRAQWAETQAKASQTQKLLEQSRQDRTEWLEGWRLKQHESQLRFDALLEQACLDRQRFDQEFAERQRAIQAQLEEIRQLGTGELL